jgi:hypothetical protein
MESLAPLRTGWIAVIGRSLRLTAVLLAGVLTTACDDPPFQPFEENTAGPFSMFGYLDLYADTQAIRITPVRQTLLPGPDPIDALVTLEDLGTRRVVTLHHRLVVFRDPSLDTVAYTHAFWTDERLRPRATYRLTATRSDGASSTVRVLMPDSIEMTFRHNDYRRGNPETGTLSVRAESLPFVELLYLIRDSCTSAFRSETVAQKVRLTNGPPLFGQSIRADTLRRECSTDVQRQEIRATTAPTGWPYDPKLLDFQIAVPNTTTANVENGLGFVGGVATWTIPYPHCDVITPRPGRAQTCEFTYNASSVSVSGRVTREPCGKPYPLAEVRLVEEFAGGGAVARVWKTAENGAYRFEGMEAGSRLSLQIGGITPAVPLPALAAGVRYTAKDTSLPGGC